MDEEIRDCWWELIYIIADDLLKEGITYSFDASTALFVHGIEFDMDDIDITVQWDCFEKLHQHFQKYGTSQIIKTNYSEFHFTINSFRVHVISSEEIVDLASDPERIKLEVEGHLLWSKTLQFYRRRISLDHPLADLIDVFLERKNLQMQ
jgi:hypothetical protein